MRNAFRFVSLAAITAVVATVPGSAQKTTGPTATYAMDVSTLSGMGMGAKGGAMTGPKGMASGMAQRHQMMEQRMEMMQMMMQMMMDRLPASPAKQ